MSSSAAVSSTTVSSSTKPSDEAKSSLDKLDLKEIFNQIGKFACRISTVNGDCGGLVLERNHIVVPFHAICLLSIAQTETTQTFYLPPITVHYNDTTFTAHKLASVPLDDCSDCDLVPFLVVDEDFPEVPEFSINQEPIVAGERVYFAGYPLNEETTSFHEGYVCSTKEEEHSFNIDGSVLPGMSGAPVFRLKENKLQLTGILLEELANINPFFSNQKEQICKMLKSANMTIGSVKLNEILSEVIRTVLDNMATGIGRVEHIASAVGLFKGTYKSKGKSSPLNLPIVKGERLPGKLATDADYCEWYHQLKQHPSKLAAIIGKALSAADKIDKKEEQVLREHYEKNVLSKASLGHKKFELKEEPKFENLLSKIESAKPKAIKSNKESWVKLLTEKLKMDLDQKLKSRAESALKTLG